MANGYDMFVQNVFCESKSYEFQKLKSGIVGNIDSKQALEDYFNIKFNEATMP
jgi:hypothetical protein